jgi:hypothetical protein
MTEFFLCYLLCDVNYLPILVAVRSNAYVCGRWIARIAGSNLSEDKDVRPLYLFCVGISICNELITRSEDGCI